MSRSEERRLAHQHGERPPEWLPPGSPEAIAQGCICPPMDNAHGLGIFGMPGHYVYVVGCPLHPEAMELREQHEEPDVLP